jgi:hypothetical protein
MAQMAQMAQMAHEAANRRISEAANQRISESANRRISESARQPSFWMKSTRQRCWVPGVSSQITTEDDGWRQWMIQVVGNQHATRKEPQHKYYTRALESGSATMWEGHSGRASNQRLKDS